MDYNAIYFIEFFIQLFKLSNNDGGSYIVIFNQICSE